MVETVKKVKTHQQPIKDAPFSAHNYSITQTYLAKARKQMDYKKFCLRGVLGQQCKKDFKFMHDLGFIWPKLRKARQTFMLPAQ